MAFRLNISDEKLYSDTFGNVTEIPDASSFPYHLPGAIVFVLFVLYILTTFISVAGNGIVCYLVFSIPKMQTIPNIFIANLSLSDITMTVVCTPFTVLSNLVFYYWPFGQVLCPIVNYIQLVTVLHRAFSLTAMTADRYNATLTKLPSKLSKKKVRNILISLWVISAGLSIPAAIFSKIYYTQDEPGSNGICAEVWGHENARLVFSVVIMILQYVLPLALMAVIYTHIALILKRRRIPGEANFRRDSRLGRSKYRTIVMLFLMVVIYAVSWLPLHVITIVGDLDPTIYDDKHVHILWLFSHWLSSSIAGSNPILYGWKNPSFRTGYKDTINRIFCRQYHKGNMKRGSAVHFKYSTETLGSAAVHFKCSTETLGAISLKSSKSDLKLNSFSNLLKPPTPL